MPSTSNVLFLCSFVCFGEENTVLGNYFEIEETDL